MNSILLPKGFSLIEPVTPHQWEYYYTLRWEVLRKPWNQPKGSEKDNMELECYHAMIIEKDGAAVAVCRLQLLVDNVGQIKSMGVNPDYQKKGFGSIIVKHLELLAKEKSALKIILHSRENAVSFYEKLGYRIIEKSYLLFDEIQHFKMEKKLLVDS